MIRHTTSLFYACDEFTDAVPLTVYLHYDDNVAATPRAMPQDAKTCDDMPRAYEPSRRHCLCRFYDATFIAR